MCLSLYVRAAARSQRPSFSSSASTWTTSTRWRVVIVTVLNAEDDVIDFFLCHSKNRLAQILVLQIIVYKHFIENEAANCKLFFSLQN